MFPNEVMGQQKTWNDILGVMLAVRDAQGGHGWACGKSLGPQTMACSASADLKLGLNQ